MRVVPECKLVDDQTQEIWERIVNSYRVEGEIGSMRGFRRSSAMLVLAITSQLRWQELKLERR